MSASQQHRLEVGEDPKFQQRSWKFQRVGFACLLLFVTAGLLGLFGGGGLLSRAEVGDGTLTVSYDRFVRFRAPAEIEASILRDSAGPFTMELDRSFVESIRFDRILPPPETVGVTPDAYVYRFAAGPSNTGISVRFFYTPKRAGLLSVTLRAGAGNAAGFTQFAMP